MGNINMKKVKFLAIFMALMMCLCFGLTACGKDDGGDNNIYYTVTFDSQGGSAVQSQRVLAGNPARAPESPTNGDLIFQGWHKSPDEGAELWNFNTDRVNDNITLYAFWGVDTSDTTEGITYELNDARNGYVVTGAGQDTKIVIPDSYEGLPVVEIGESAFAYSRHTSDILSVTIPDSVTAIGLNAFHNQDALVSVNIGTNSKLTSIGNNAFSGNGALTSFYLPTGFTTLGNDVFNNCGSLNTFTVSNGNEVYSGEGNNLIEIASHTLIRGTNQSKIPSSVTEIAPSAFRRANGITELFIPLSVEKIGNYFVADSTIATIKYEGTEEQWGAIEKSATMWNYGNREVIVEYDVKPTTGAPLIAFFSRADENYSVGYIEKGNTHIIAEMISSYTGGELFHIERSTPYPAKYDDCTDEAKREQSNNARPALKENIDISGYDVIYLGYPNWWGDMPMPVYTFIESHNWEGKTVIPFCTHAGSGLSNTVSTLRSKLTGATVKNGLSIAGTTAQNNRTAANNAVYDFLSSNGLI